MCVTMASFDTADMGLRDAEALRNCSLGRPVSEEIKDGGHLVHAESAAMTET